MSPCGGIAGDVLFIVSLPHADIVQAGQVNSEDMSAARGCEIIVKPFSISFVKLNYSIK